MITINRDSLYYCSSGCGGGYYSGTASYEGKTVKEVLQEIKQYFQDKGNPWTDNSYYFVSIDGYTVIGYDYWSRGEYDPKRDDEKIVDHVNVVGGFWADFNFKIWTVKKKKHLITRVKERIIKSRKKER